MLGFPLPYRDELLYSTIARHRIHSGIVSPKELLLEVFGDTKVLATSDLPSHLGRIAELYPAALGVTPLDLLYQNTLFPLYAPFVGETRRIALIRELTANDKSAVHLAVGVAASRIRQPIYLRYCPACMCEQVSKHGECYWRRDWQVAGADSCPAHGSLINSKTRRHDAQRHEFMAADSNICPLIDQLPGKWQSYLLAESIDELLNLGTVVVPELPQWSLWYANLATEHRLTRGIQMRHELIREKVVGYWGASWLSLYGLMPDDSETNWLKNIFRKHRKAFSYLEHLVVLYAFMEPKWKLVDVVDRVARLKLDKKIPTKILGEKDNPLLIEYRSRWLAVVEKQGTKQARLNGFGGVYAWLYRRDRNWLFKTNQTNRKLEPKHKAKVDWPRRDKDIVRKLIGILELSEQKLDTPRLSMNWYLNQLKHKAQIEKHLDLLPLCSLFFVRYCESIFEYQIRRITRTVIHITRDDEPLKRWQVLRGASLSEQRLTNLARRFLEEVLEI